MSGDRALIRKAEEREEDVEGCFEVAVVARDRELGGTHAGWEGECRKVELLLLS